MEYITSFFEAFLGLMKTFRIADLLDVAVVAFIIYSTIKLVRDTRAGQLLKGILILLVAYSASYILNLRMLSSILGYLFQFGVMALLIVFQPELRKGLEQIGRSDIGSYWSFATSIKGQADYSQRVMKSIDVVSKVADMFKKSKTGALIVFERKTKLGEIIDTGTIIDAVPSVELIGNIFYNKAPLHDGAMMMKDGVVRAAGCILPLTKNEHISTDLGTRHRAAIGMSEESDAVVVVVSEETGNISVVTSGTIKRNYTKETLKLELQMLLLPDINDIPQRKILRPSLRKVRKNVKK